MTWTVADLFSGSGGMSYGFHAHPDFELVGAVDAQIGKPSSRAGALECNQSYEANMGFAPHEANLAEVDGAALVELLREQLDGRALDILLACPPCTGFSRANPKNHADGDPRNVLVPRVAVWVEALQPQLVFLENARELLTGNLARYSDELVEQLEALGYQVHRETHLLNKFGLPQRRERALLVAAHPDVAQFKTIDDLWEGHTVQPEATHVRRAIEGLEMIGAGRRSETDAMHESPPFSPSASTERRLAAIPHDGGSWSDLVGDPATDELLTPAMRRSVAEERLNSHPDVYGRLAWDRPSVTIKRECAHVGNGRYSHPEQDRHLTVREMAILQGFPSTYTFVGRLANKFRHIGDAVPPLISHQLAWLARWMLTGERPDMADVVLANTHLLAEDIVPSSATETLP